MQVNEIINIMKKIAPPYLAEKWDNIGLLVGSTVGEVKRILITLDVTPAVVNEAIEKKVDLIIAHHPLIFKGLKSITNQSVQGQMLLDLIRYNINVYAAHTNLDSVENGMNDWLAKQLNLNNTKALMPTMNEMMYRLSITIPFQLLDTVKSTLFEVGVYNIIEDNDISNKEMKLEVEVSEKKLTLVMQTLKQTYLDEISNYHISALDQQANNQGIGKIGQLPKNVTLLEMAKQCKQAFNTPMVKMIGQANKVINKVAIVGGSGRDYISQAKALGADVYITGDITYHVALDALELGMAVIDAGHYIEHIVKVQLSQILIEELDNQDIEVIQSTINTNPYKYIMS